MPKLAAGVVINVAIFAALLFLPTRNLDWWRACVLLGVMFVGAVASTVLVSLLLALFVAAMAFAAIDVFRLHLIPKPGPVASAVGLVLVIAGWWIMTLALQANPFAAPAVKHQEERHQVAVDRGLSSRVRHSMYAGAVPFFVSMPLWLESYAATVLALVLVVVMVARIHVEKRFLRRELPGYDAYTRRVRYRLIRFVW